MVQSKMSVHFSILQLPPKQRRSYIAESAGKVKHDSHSDPGVLQVGECPLQQVDDGFLLSHVELISKLHRVQIGAHHGA